jgi:hypothetical protein
MEPNELRGFRLTVLNPGGHDREQSFPDGAGEAGGQHAPVNFHGFAACTRGTFHRETARALAENTPVLLLLRSDFRTSQRALVQLKKQKRIVAVSLKETGLHQIAQQLRDPGKLLRFQNILATADGSLGTTPEATEIYRSFIEKPVNHLPGGTPAVASHKFRDETALVPPMTANLRVAFIPTPYPVADTRWDFSRSNDERAGVFVGTREWNVPTRNHLAALLLAREISAITHERVTVFNGDGRAGVKLLAALDFPAGRLRVIDRRLSYADYLREVSRHKIVLQLDTSFVPGQVAGDALLCRLPCVGGNGAIDRLAFAETCGFARAIAEIKEIATRLLQDSAFYERVIVSSQKCAKEHCGFEGIANRLRDFFSSLA